VIRHLHWLTQSRIRRLFAVGMTPSAERSLFEAVTGCAVCGEHYRQHQRLEDALCAADDGPSVFALERVEARLLAASGAAQPGRGPWSWLLLPAGAAALALLLIAIWPAGQPEHRVSLGAQVELAPVEWASRGGGDAALSKVGVRMFRVQAQDKGVEEEGPLSIDDVVTFTYTNVASDVGYLTLVGVQEGGLLLWYYPDHGEGESISIDGDRIDEPLADGIRLGVNHRPGWLRISALFSAAPLGREEVEAAMERLGPEPSELQPLSGLDEEVLEHVFLVEIEGHDE